MGVKRREREEERREGRDLLRSRFIELGAIMNNPVPPLCPINRCGQLSTRAPSISLSMWHASQPTFSSAPPHARFVRVQRINGTSEEVLVPSDKPAAAAVQMLRDRDYRNNTTTPLHLARSTALWGAATMAHGPILPPATTRSATANPTHNEQQTARPLHHAKPSQQRPQANNRRPRWTKPRRLSGLRRVWRSWR